MERIIARGAEAVIIKNNSKSLIKKRPIKSYRHPTLDEKLRKSRTRQESKLLEKSSKVISVPKIIFSDENKKEIILENIVGKKLSENLDSLKNKNNVASLIGKNIAKLHDIDIIHGDLTTSNMILKGNRLYFIDFGLGFQSSRIEDKATDLHLIKEAISAKHPNHSSTLFKNILQGYSISKNSKKVLKQLEKVESRGRYKEQY